jgi:hypothetical protein
VDLESLSVHLKDAITGSTKASELGGNVDIRGGWHVFIRVAQAALGTSRSVLTCYFHECHFVRVFVDASYYLFLLTVSSPPPSPPSHSQASWISC